MCKFARMSLALILAWALLPGITANASPADKIAGGLASGASYALGASLTPLAGNTLYVGSNSAYSPLYPTLDAAVAAAQDGDTVIVTEDLTMTQRAYIANKHLTIKGINAGITLSRGNPFDVAVDGNRGQFNPGMLEVATDVSNPSAYASVRLENIIFDDRSNPQGFTGPHPAGSNTDAGWRDNVYDATLSAYSSNATITLGPGTQLVNTGGASAIRVT
ncbi:MAG: hypothetical protein LBS58_00040, partial [Coriobacteriales bacterium]|nr:hypothetical protein [Coriobacteriales bacterium]